MRSTSEWEAALEGVTEGTWEVGSSGTEVYYVTEYGRGIIADTGSHIARLWPDDDSGALDQAYADARLIALSREAVAEVVRLRRELEELAHGAYVMANEHYYAGGNIRDDLGSVEKHYYMEIARILEGTNE